MMKALRFFAMLTIIGGIVIAFYAVKIGIGLIYILLTLLHAAGL